MCKFYQGSEDKQLELQLKKLFQWVHREKPESSRSVSIPLESARSIICLRSLGIKRGIFCSP